MDRKVPDQQTDRQAHYYTDSWNDAIGEQFFESTYYFTFWKSTNYYIGTRETTAELLYEFKSGRPLVLEQTNRWTKMTYVLVYKTFYESKLCNP